MQCNKMSLWLATHLTDLLEKLNLVDDDDDETYELPLRDYFVFQYTDMLLLGHEGYWEVACDYLSGCGAQGVGRIREILKRISLNIGNSPNFTQTDDNEDAVMEGEYAVVLDINAVDTDDTLLMEPELVRTEEEAAESPEAVLDPDEVVEMLNELVSTTLEFSDADGCSEMVLDMLDDEELLDCTWFAM